MKGEKTTKSEGWLRGGAIGVGSFLIAVVLSGLATAPFCAGRDLRLWAFLTAPVSLLLGGVVIAWFRLCGLRHIVLTLCVLFIVAALVNDKLGGPSQNAVTAALLLGVPWCLGLFGGHALRRKREGRTTA